MMIFLDIDGPLACKNEEILTRLYARYLPLNIPEDQLSRVASVQEFHTLPEVLAFLATVGTFKYKYLIDLLVFLPEHLAQATVTERAQEGVHRLTQHQVRIGYCTARRGNTESWTQQVREATATWLERYQFPCPHTILYCEDSQGKLQAIANVLRTDQPEPILLIDDLYGRIIDQFSTLEVHEQKLLSQYFVLGAYGAQEAPVAPFRTIPLKDWSDIDQFLYDMTETLSKLTSGIPLKTLF